MDAAPEPRGLLIGSPAQGVRSLSSADLNAGPEAGGRGDRPDAFCSGARPVEVTTKKDGKCRDLEEVCEHSHPLSRHRGRPPGGLSGA